MIGDFRPSLEKDAKQYGVAVSRLSYPEGVAGAKLVLQEMGRRIREGMIAPSMRAFAEMVVRNWARVPVAEQIGDRRAAQIFLDYVRENVRYRYDPDNTEMTMSAPVTLCIPGAPMCIPVGDCDDLVVALGSLMGAYGMQIRIMKQSFGDSNVEHVLVVFKDGESWLPADPSAPGKEVGWRASATKEVLVNPADPKSLNLEGEPESIFVGVGSIPLWARVGRIGAVMTTPGDVLAFRQMWDPYVSAIYNAMLACSNAWSSAAAGSNTPTSGSVINTAQFAVPPDATTLKLWASGMAQDAATLQTQWNYYQGLVTTSAGAAQFMSIAPDVLQFFQATVLHAGQYYVPEIQKNCPGIGASIPAPPTFDVQSQVIGQIEGLQLIAKGALGFLGIGTSGALEFYKRLGQKGEQVIDTTTNNLPLILGAGIALGAAVVAVEVLPLIPRGQRSVKRAAAEARKLMRRRRRWVG